MLLVVGQDTDYAGDVYFDNIKVYKSDTTEGDIPSEIYMILKRTSQKDGTFQTGILKKQ